MIQLDNRMRPDLLANGFASHVVRWASQRQRLSDSASAMLHQSALQVSHASANGHVCTRLVDIVATSPSWNLTALRACLLSSSVVGTAENPGANPLILDEDDRLYLHRYFDYECRLARRLMQPRSPFPAYDPALQARLASLFGSKAPLPPGRPDWQKLAAALSLLSPLTIISGGPGTGKTTTVVNLLACLLEQNLSCRIALAAPTGKAAARMQEAIRLRAGHLPVEIQARLPSESFTIHRLLGTSGSGKSFRYHAEAPLPIDVLVVDEASMLDLGLATKLFEAVPTSARIILLGDKDQLAAVEAGAIFSELSCDPTLSLSYIAALAQLTQIPAPTIQPAPPSKVSALQDSVIWFSENFRFSERSGIGRLAALINAGEDTSASHFLETNCDASITWLSADGLELDPASLSAMRQGYHAYLEAIQRNDSSPGALFEAFGAFRVLCAVHDTPRGTTAINLHISQAMRAATCAQADTTPASAWYRGRPIMVLRNDYALQIFNGDIGIALPDADGVMMVYFPDGAAGFRAIAPVRLPEHDTAYAMTVHKSQGSEFEKVMVVLPAQSHRVLSRELLYTAVTRARSNVTLIASAPVLAETIRTTTVRHSGLIARLAQAQIRSDVVSANLPKVFIP